MLKCLEYDHINRIKIKKINVLEVNENDRIVEAIKSQTKFPGLNSPQSSKCIKLKILPPVSGQISKE
mgnify:CR=1 FL=1